MCVRLSKGQEPKLAEHDITVYKVFRKDIPTDGYGFVEYKAPFRNEFIYEDVIDKEYSCTDFGKKSKLGGIKGFHSYKKKDDAIRTSCRLNDIYTFYPRSYCREGYTSINLLLPTKIPSGSLFYEVFDDDGEPVYVSNKIKLCLN